METREAYEEFLRVIQQLLGVGDDSVANCDDVGVVVGIEEDEEEESSDLDMVMGDEEQDEHDLLKPNESGPMQMQIGGDIDDAYNEGMSLNVQDIDAYWLEKRISEAYEKKIDPQQCQKLSEEVLKILAEGQGS
ncbi:hypothetical protein L3X38_020116 [Prunus dulcis]|uniref:Brr2 N-terminal helicase PWI domain-containing protein n=1 Tax=Prunus dulcis TaxID=3755 RepID=A0AAD4WEF2_PRUDU|nr:hypothetical protein L3X38_020116 [Prunus dulcis]